MGRPVGAREGQVCFCMLCLPMSIVMTDPGRMRLVFLVLANCRAAPPLLQAQSKHALFVVCS